MKKTKSFGNNELDEREFELVNIVGAELGANQRDISRSMNLSLGMVNILIQRLISKGIIRISQLDSRKVQYIVTPKGFSEKMRKSVKYTLKTINSLELIKNKIHEIVVPLYHAGERNFIILGKSDFARLTEIIFKDLGFNDCHINYWQELPQHGLQGTVLICKENINEFEHNGNRIINLIEELAKDQRFINHSSQGVEK